MCQIICVWRWKNVVEMLSRKKYLISGQNWRWYPGFRDWKDGGQVYNDEQGLTCGCEIVGLCQVNLDKLV